MVDAITAVAASSASTPTRVESSLSITSEPDNKWVAERQAQIDADLAALTTGPVDGHLSEETTVDEDMPPLFEGHARRQRTVRGIQSRGGDEGVEDHLLSGESEEIGTANFDDQTPFGHRVAIV